MAIHGQAIPTQRIFRVLLNAMSHPGRSYHLPFKGYWPTPWLAVADTLLDHEVSFAVLGEKHTDDVAAEILTATKARAVDPTVADYIVVLGSNSQGAIYKSKHGTLEYPDWNATFIYVLYNAKTPPIYGVRLSGPGISEPISPQMNGLDPRELEDIRTVNKEYPSGIDCIFLDEEDHVMCIPRSTNIKIG
jgi:alpha-D-ribose 1-methylphosphonate 5-triphosphate synthase subunit PhnH